MVEKKLDEVAVSTAAEWLSVAGILADSTSSPGFSLRRHIHRGNIFGAFKKNNYFWYIRKMEDYQEILTSQELSQILGLKSRTSIYRKVQKENIPYKKIQDKSMYFLKPDLLKWAIERNHNSLYKSLQTWGSQLTGANHDC